MTSERRAFYRKEGDSYVPTGLGISPWNGTSQVGMALAGLAGHVLAQVPTLEPMMTTRISIDILGTVPLEPLVPQIKLLRNGKRIQVVDVEFRSGERLWLRATAVRARIGDSPKNPVPPVRRFWNEDDPKDSYFWYEERQIDLDRSRVGPGSIWVRFTADVVEGEPFEPLSLLAMLGDFGNGTAPLIPLDEGTLANLDIVVSASRMPEGEWMLIDAESETAGNGLGYSRTRIGDRQGMFATGTQSIFVGPPFKIVKPGAST